ncbi:hypothetical protein ABW20_dc0101170 [Dactylellina cionopaga]|nr:hypothetical protein ABW20_dc0101170 [Dactylellina cionopaga]
MAPPMPQSSLVDFWNTILPRFQAILTPHFSSPDEKGEHQHAYNILHPHSITFATFLSVQPLEATSEAYILELVHAANALLEEADKNVNILQYAPKGKRWRSVHSYAAYFIAIAIIAYVVRIRTRALEEVEADGEASEQHWTVQDAIYHLDFAIIKTGGWPITTDMQELLRTVDRDLLPLVDSAHEVLDWRANREEWGRATQHLDLLRYPGKEIESPSIQQWVAIYRRQQPIKLKSIIDHWPVFDIEGLPEAMRKSKLTSRWSSIPYLLSKTINGRRIVPVEVGKTYTDPGLKQKLMAFREYIDTYLLPNHAILEDSKKEGGVFGYLAQHNLLTQIPSLREDICVPDYINYTADDVDSDDEQDQVEATINAWLGPANTITPLHTDNYHNIFCQVVGSKYVRLYPPNARDAMFPLGKDEKGVDMGNTSSIPPDWVESDSFKLVAGDSEPEKDENEIREQWKRFKEAEYIEFLVRGGEAVFFPVSTVLLQIFCITW